MLNLKFKSWIDSVRVTRITKEFIAVYRLFLIIVIYGKETYKAKQRQKLANFFTTYEKSFVIQVNTFVSFCLQ